MKQQRPVNLSMGQVLSVNLQSPVAIASILHRLSGILIFVLIPLILWLLQTSLASQQGFNYVVHDVFGNIFVKLLVWAFSAGLYFHVVMGTKHLLADLSIGETLRSGRLMASVALVIALAGVAGLFVWMVL